MKEVIKKTLRIIWKIFRTILIIILIPFAIYALSWTYHRLDASLHSKESKWLLDLNSFEASLIDKHVNPNWRQFNTSDKIKKGIDSLRQVVLEKEGEVDRDSMRVSLMQISALLQDGHSHIANYADDTGNFPIVIQFYKDGLFVVAADSALMNLLGSKIIAINNNPITKVIEKIHSICPSPNESSQKMYIESYIKKPGILYGLGLIDNNRSAIFHFEHNDGSRLAVEMNGFSEEKGQVSIDDVQPFNKPLHRKDSQKEYWYEYNSQSAMLYMKYNKVFNMGNDPMDSFVDRMMHLIDSVRIDKFIIDIRNNGGGDNYFTSRLVTEIQKRSKINKKGVLYVITGHQTFSAAICFAGNLSTRTRATFVGEPFADFNNLPGDAQYFDFHMNRMTWQVSKFFWENTYYEDNRNTIIPDIPYLSSFEEDHNGENPLIKLILADHPVDTENTWHAPDSLQSIYNGRYKFSPDKTLELDLAIGKIKLSGLIESDLSYRSDTVFRVDNLRFNLVLKKGQLVVMKDDSTQRIIERLAEDDFTALELIQLGEYQQARNKYLALKEQYGDSLVAISVNNLSTIANYLYLGTGNNQMQTELLKITLEMYPNEMMPLARMSTAKAIDKEKISSIFFGMRSLWYFDWRNLDNYGKAFGFF